MYTVSKYLNRTGTVQMKIQACATILTFCQIHMNQRAVVHLGKQTYCTQCVDYTMQPRASHLLLGKFYDEKI